MESSPITRSRASEALERQLTGLLRQASESPERQADAVRALAALAPERAAAWLLDHGAPRDGLAAIVVRRAIEAGEPGPAVRELAAASADSLSAGALADLVRALTEDAHREALMPALGAALDREPGHAGLLRIAADHAQRVGDPSRAHELLTRLGRADPSPATLHYIWKRRSRLPAPSAPPVRLAVIGSYTMDPLVHAVDLECRALGLGPEIYVTPFNSWGQEILDDSSDLRRFEPEIAFMALSIDDLIPRLGEGLARNEVEEAGSEAVGRVVELARAFCANGAGSLIVHSFHSAFRDPAGSADAGGSRTRAEWLRDLNARLATELGSVPRCYLLDTEDVLLRRTGGALDNPKMRHLAAMRMCGPVAVEVARAWARCIAPLKGLVRKCVVLDLDNTLWGGIVGEDGPDGIRLGHTAPGSEYVELQRYLKSLTKRGFLLAVNSKNNPDDALEVIRSHPEMVLRVEDFAALRINWVPKPENMRAIADELNIGIDSLVFLDDNPHERELMRQALPEVLTPELPADPSLYRETVEALPQLSKLQVTDEDRSRARLYRARRKRESAREGAATLEDYLGSLGIAVEIGQADESALPRVAQLFERTNQFNLTTRRHTAARLAARSEDPGWRLYTLRARDRFGDHGLVATALVRAEPERWTIDSFLMSCRVIGYGVETALLATIGEDAGAAGADDIIGELVETPKNVPARDFYPRHGFDRLDEGEGVSRWALDPAAKPVAVPAWIAVGDGHGA